MGQDLDYLYEFIENEVEVLIICSVNPTRLGASLGYLS
jgi:hypothetical protein